MKDDVSRMDATDAGLDVSACRTSRRSFLASASLSLAAAAASAGCKEVLPHRAPAERTGAPAGQPPAFGTAPAFGPDVTAATFSEAERLVQVDLDVNEVNEAAGNWRSAMAPLYERRVGPRKVALGAEVAPFSLTNPLQFNGDFGGYTPPGVDRFIRSAGAVLAIPADDEAIAFAPVTELGGWLRTRQITSERLTGIYLERLRRFDPELHCVITLTAELAMQQARQADAEIAAGRYRGPLHGVPWGAKDLLDTAGIRTTYGAEPYKNRVPTSDAHVVAKLRDAGAVLVAKLSLGALALNDVWFGGQTRNPWLLEEGSSGSSAGPGAAVAAGLVGFAVGSETGGSIVSPSMRCGVNGLRPTFGRVGRSGAMTLCWSLDKLGPMARSVEDTMLVLNALSGFDPADTGSVASHLDYDANTPVSGLRVGYFPAWMREAPATDVDRAALAMVTKLGMTPVEVSLPDWPYDNLNLILFAEAAASFEELTQARDERFLTMQVPDAWPNTFRQARFLSAVDFVQTDRMRRKVAFEMRRIFSQVDMLLVPSLRDEMLTITNFTGQPSLTLRAGFVTVREARSDWAPDPDHPMPQFDPPRRVPHGVTLIGRLFDEGTIGRAGLAMERAFGVAGERPAGF